MPCPRCNGVTKHGAQCRLPTCKWAPRCHLHTEVEVRPSNIPNAGRGLFAKTTLRKGDVVADYKLGTEPLTAAQFLARYPNRRATHVALVHGTYYDARDAHKSVAGMANRAPSGGRNNARINGNGRLEITAKTVPSGREILLSYGAGYRL